MKTTVSARSYLTAGMAALTVGAVVAMPIQAPADVQVPAASSAQVELTANPFSTAITAFTNASILADRQIADPTPIFSQLATNQFTYLQASSAAAAQTTGASAVALQTVIANLQTAIGTGNLALLAQTVTQAALLPPALVLTYINLINPTVIQPAAQNFADVIAVLPVVSLEAFGALTSPLIGTAQALGVSTQTVLSRALALDLAGAVGAALNAPVDAVDAFLNGTADPDGAGPGRAWAGVLTPGDGAPGGAEEGTVATFQIIQKQIKEALKPGVLTVPGSITPPPAPAPAPAPATLRQQSNIVEKVAIEKAPAVVADDDAAADDVAVVDNDTDAADAPKAAKPGDNLRKASNELRSNLKKAGDDARDNITKAVKSITKNLKPRKAKAAEGAE